MFIGFLDSESFYEFPKIVIGDEIDKLPTTYALESMQWGGGSNYINVRPSFYGDNNVYEWLDSLNAFSLFYCAGGERATTILLFSMLKKSFVTKPNEKNLIHLALSRSGPAANHSVRPINNIPIETMKHLRRSHENNKTEL